MRTFFLVIATGLWSALVFLLTLWLTFPSDDFALRLRAEVPARLGRDWSADVASVSPWWLGVTAHDLRLYEESPTGEAEPRALFDSASIAVSPLRSLLRRTPYFVGQLEFLDGSLGFQVGTVQAGKKERKWSTSDLVIWSDGVPLGDLLALSGKLPATLTGNVAVDIDVRGGSGGLSESNGHIKITGSNLVVSDVEIPGLGPLGLEIPIDGVAIEAEVDKGQATFSNCLLRSPLFTLELKGTVGLRDPIERSNVDIELVLSDLGSELKFVEGTLTSAKGTDGNYHFFGRGVLGRMSSNSFSMGKPGVGRGGRRAAVAADDGGDGGDDPLLTPSEGDEDRAKRRQEIKERLRQKREERRAGRAAGKVGPAEDGAEPPPPVKGEDEEPLPPIEEVEEPVDEEPVEGPPDEEPLE